MQLDFSKISCLVSLFVIFVSCSDKKESGNKYLKFIHDDLKISQTSRLFPSSSSPVRSAYVITGPEEEEAENLNELKFEKFDNLNQFENFENFANFNELKFEEFERFDKLNELNFEKFEETSFPLASRFELPVHFQEPIPHQITHSPFLEYKPFQKPESIPPHSSFWDFRLFCTETLGTVLRPLRSLSDVGSIFEIFALRKTENNYHVTSFLLREYPNFSWRRGNFTTVSIKTKYENMSFYLNFIDTKFVQPHLFSGFLISIDLQFDLAGNLFIKFVLDANISDPNIIINTLRMNNIRVFQVQEQPSLLLKSSSSDSYGKSDNFYGKKNLSHDLSDFSLPGNQRFPDKYKIWGVFWGYPQEISESSDPIIWLRSLGKYRFTYKKGCMGQSAGSVYSLISYPYANLLAVNESFYSMEYTHFMVNSDNFFGLLFDMNPKLFPYALNEVIVAIVIENSFHSKVKVNIVVNRFNEGRLACSVENLLLGFGVHISDYAPFEYLHRL